MGHVDVFGAGALLRASMRAGQRFNETPLCTQPRGEHLEAPSLHGKTEELCLLGPSRCLKLTGDCPATWGIVLLILLAKNMLLHC